MAKDGNDSRTQELLHWQPGTLRDLVARFDDARVRASTLRDRIALAVAATLEGRDRDDVARQMTAFLSEKVTVNMLNAYASQARGDHSIGFVRAMALVKVTKDPRLLQLMAEMIGHSVIPNRYLHWIEVAKSEEAAKDAQARHRRALKAVGR